MWPYGKLGYVLAGEEHSASQLIRLGCAAEAVGFSFAFVSDHFHPWNTQQGHSSYIWSVLGALAVSTQSLGLISAVTCPISRVHPTTLAQAASTVAQLSDGRFILGLGSGENLNEHITGLTFPRFPERLERLEEALLLTRQVLSGEEVSAQGSYFCVDRAQLFDAAVELPIYLAASGPKAARLAKDKADGLICLGADCARATDFRRDSSDTRPRVTQLSVCWGENYEQAVEMAHQHFPEVAMPGTTFARLATPAEFSRAAESVQLGDVAASIVCGPDPEPYQAAIEECFDAGFDAVALHQIGPEQEGFLNFCKSLGAL